MTFEEWCIKNYGFPSNNLAMFSARDIEKAWNAQQAKIDELILENEKLRDLLDVPLEIEANHEH